MCAVSVGAELHRLSTCSLAAAWLRNTRSQICISQYTGTLCHSFMLCAFPCIDGKATLHVCQLTPPGRVRGLGRDVSAHRMSTSSAPHLKEIGRADGNQMSRGPRAELNVLRSSSGVLLHARLHCMIAGACCHHDREGPTCGHKLELTAGTASTRRGSSSCASLLWQGTWKCGVHNCPPCSRFDLPPLYHSRANSCSTVMSPSCGIAKGCATLPHPHPC